MTNSRSKISDESIKVWSRRETLQAISERFANYYSPLAKEYLTVVESDLTRRQETYKYLTEDTLPCLLRKLDALKDLDDSDETTDKRYDLMGQIESLLRVLKGEELPEEGSEKSPNRGSAAASEADSTLGAGLLDLSDPEDDTASTEQGRSTGKAEHRTAEIFVSQTSPTEITVQVESYDTSTSPGVTIVSETLLSDAVLEDAGHRYKREDMCLIIRSYLDPPTLLDLLRETTAARAPNAEAEAQGSQAERSSSETQEAKNLAAALEEVDFSTIDRISTLLCHTSRRESRDPADMPRNARLTEYSVKNISQRTSA